MACRGNAPRDVSISSHESSPDRGGVAANDLNRNANGMKRLVLSCWLSAVMTLIARHNRDKSQLRGQKRSPWSQSTHHVAISTEPLQSPRSKPVQPLVSYRSEAAQTPPIRGLFRVGLLDRAGWRSTINGDLALTQWPGLAPPNRRPSVSLACECDRSSRDRPLVRVFPTRPRCPNHDCQPFLGLLDALRPIPSDRSAGYDGAAV